MKNRGNTDMIVSDYRYERKFSISELSEYDVENIVKMHPAIFSEIFSRRDVNNIYFDFVDLDNYYDNIEGATDRIKIRVRWYGPLFGYIKKPILEIKVKKGFLGKKISIPLKPFDMKDNADICNILNPVNDFPESLTIDFKTIRPTLLNKYSRKYYQSCNRNYRITIDTDQVFHQINRWGNSFLNRAFDKNNVILELKYDKEFDFGAKDISSKFPFRVTKSSKYVCGMQKVLEVEF